MIAVAPSLITPTIAACLAISGGVHVVIYLLNATLPLHVVGLGGSKTQVGLLFATSTSVSMILRPLVGGWVDRFGARRVMLPGVAVLLATLVLLPVAAAPAAYVALMAGLGCGNGVLATAAGVLVAQASPAARRGEALSVYFLATALSFAAGPPLGLALYARAGIQACFAASVGLGAADRGAHPESQGAGPGGRVIAGFSVVQPACAAGGGDGGVREHRVQLDLRLPAPLRAGLGPRG